MTDETITLFRLGAETNERVPIVANVIMAPPMIAKASPL